MKCPFCGRDNTRVIDSRPSDDNNAIRRRRVCDVCGNCLLYTSKKNLLTDWTDKAAADSEFMDGFYEGTVDGWQYDGKTYGLPGLVNVYGVFYNKDILANAGLAEPSADWTWADLFEYAEKLKDPSDNKFGLYGLNTDIFGLTNISVSEGGSPFVDSLTHTTNRCV